MTSGSSSSMQLPARSVKTSPHGKLGPVMRILNVRGVQLWLPQGSSEIWWMTRVAPFSQPAQHMCVGLQQMGCIHCGHGQEDAHPQVWEESRLCVIPQTDGERLCWSFKGTFGGAAYYVFIDAKTGEAADILRVAQTADGETAI